MGTINSFSSSVTVKKKKNDTKTQSLKSSTMLFSLGDISLKRQLTVTDTINTIMKQFNCVAVLNESPVVQTVFAVINFLTSLRHQVNITSPTSLVKLFLLCSIYQPSSVQTMKTVNYSGSRKRIHLI